MTSILLPSLSIAKKNLTTKDLERVLQKPLIVGASISANYGTDSPSRRLALHYTDTGDVATHAFGGRPGKDTWTSLSQELLKDRTAILAMDLFFWDSTLRDSKESVKTLEDLMKKAKKQDLIVVLGEIPELLPGRQPQRQKLNQVLKDACSDYDKCYLMPFIELHAKVMRDRYLMIDGKRMTFTELVPDGLHLSDTASHYLANVMREVLLGRNPSKITKTTW